MESPNNHFNKMLSKLVPQGINNFYSNQAH